MEIGTINQPDGIEDDKYEGPLTSPSSCWDLDLYLSGRELFEKFKNLSISPLPQEDLEVSFDFPDHSSK